MENDDFYPEEILPTVSGGDAVVDVQPMSGEELYDVVYAAVYDAYVAQTVTDGQSISNTALEYFKGLLAKESPFIDYVIYVGQPYQYWNYNYEQTGYEYCMAYGDLELSGTTFTGTADIVTMRTAGEQWVSYKNDQAVSITAPLYFSRSNLGDYSSVIQYDYINTGILIALLIGGLTWLVRKFLGG